MGTTSAESAGRPPAQGRVGCFPGTTRRYAARAPGEAKAAWPPVALQGCLCRAPSRLEAQKCPQAEQITTTPKESEKVAICNLCPFGSHNNFLMFEA